MNAVGVVVNVELNTLDIVHTIVKRAIRNHLVEILYYTYIDQFTWYLVRIECNLVRGSICYLFFSLPLLVSHKTPWVHCGITAD